MIQIVLHHSHLRKQFLHCDATIATLQNHQRWTNLARMYERYQLSDRAGAAIATSALQDMEMVTDKDKSLVINPSKLREERCREEICQEKVSNFKFVTGLYFDSRKDASQVIVEGPNGKMCGSTQLEQHYVLVGEPGTYYLTRLSSIDGKGRTLTQEIFEFILETVLCEKLIIINTDETASMTDSYLQDFVACIKTHPFSKPSSNCQILYQCLFSNVVEIKKQSQIIHGAKNFFNLVHHIQYNSFNTAKFALLCLKLCKEMLFLHILKMFFWVCWGMMMKKLEDWQLTKFKLCEENHCNILFQMATSKEVTSRAIEKQKVLLT